MDHEFSHSGFCMQKPRGRGHHHLAGGGGGATTGSKCGRWNPTTEQVTVLTDLFRAGLRTPSTDQIQKISSQLSFYGKIESKNVFYWFQNHKARERQKRRRVSVDEGNDENCYVQEKVSSAKNFTESNQVPEPERVVETLQLFPLNSFTQTEPEKFRFLSDDCKENSNFSYNIIGTEMDHPMLDLRLSFI